MDVSVVIRTKNEAACIEKTLEKVQTQNFNGHYEVIVVDSESTDGTLDLVRRFATLVIEMPQSQFTYGRSLNLGVEHAKGNFIVNLSAHAFPSDEKWLSNLISGFEDASVAGIYGRQISVGHKNPFEARQNEMFFGSEGLKFSSINKRGLREIHFSNANCAIRRSVWEKCKFDESAPYAEDFLWQKKVVGKGFSILYAPTAAVYHTHEPDVIVAHRFAKKCAYTLAVMTKSRPSCLPVALDLAMFLIFFLCSMAQNLWYVCKRKYYKHLIRTPLYVASTWLGWLLGRVQYRLGR